MLDIQRQHLPAVYLNRKTWLAVNAEMTIIFFGKSMNAPNCFTPPMKTFLGENSEAAHSISNQVIRYAWIFINGCTSDQN